MSQRGLITLGEETFVVSIESSLTNDAVINQIAASRISGDPPNSDPLPDNCRWAFRDTRFQKFVVELKPGVFPLAHENFTRVYKVAMPWQYFIIPFVRTEASYWVIPSIRLGWARRRIDSLDTISLSPPHLPNISDGSYEPCMGSTMPDSTLPVWKRVNDIVSGYFAPENTMNNDLAFEWPNGYSGPYAWARASKLNPLCYLQWNYDYQMSVRHLLDQSLYDPETGERIDLDRPIRSMRELVNRLQFAGSEVW